MREGMGSQICLLESFLSCLAFTYFFASAELSVGGWTDGSICLDKAFRNGNRSVGAAACLSLGNKRKLHRQMTWSCVIGIALGGAGLKEGCVGCIELGTSLIERDFFFRSRFIFVFFHACMAFV